MVVNQIFVFGTLRDRLRLLVVNAPIARIRLSGLLIAPLTLPVFACQSFEFGVRAKPFEARSLLHRV